MACWDILKLHAGHNKEHVWAIKSIFKSTAFLKGCFVLIAQEEATPADKWEQVIHTGKWRTSCHQGQCKNQDLSLSWNPGFLVSTTLGRPGDFLTEPQGQDPGRFWVQSGPATHSLYEGGQITRPPLVFISSRAKWEQSLPASQGCQRLWCYLSVFQPVL